MHLQNRVDPWGNLIAVSARGAWMGNRGVLHDAQKNIVSKWKRKSWVICELEFKSRQRQVFGPNTYSELFFLDEATAFSAGHRPCATCRRDRYNAFKDAWIKANRPISQSNPSITDIDRQIHDERISRDGKKVTFIARIADLPDGTFIEYDENAYLLWEKRLHRWSPHGYFSTAETMQPEDKVLVLTPFSIVQIFMAGFKPQVHESACRPC